MNVLEKPNFQDPSFLCRHIDTIMSFYHPTCIDQKNGGFFHCFRDDGSIYDPGARHLVSSARFVFVYAMASMLRKKEAYLDAVRHGVTYLQASHLNVNTGGYAWTISNGKIEDSTNHCYGLAFVLLAYASALQAGITEARNMMYQTYDLMEQRFWSQNDQLYMDEISPDWREVSPYRGQNANMHACEAVLAAYIASHDEKFLERAEVLAHRLTVDLAEQSAIQTTGGVTGIPLIWEHYDTNWKIDWNYNKDDPRNLFRPWGFQPGHQIEWAKLLLILSRYRDQAWMTKKACDFFDIAIRQSWDNQYGGIMYGFTPDGSICDDDKYFWVHAEGIATAALLAKRTGEAKYYDWYNRIWEYSWIFLVDHKYGAWYRILNRQNQKYDNLKSPPGKTDYHTLAACYTALGVFT